MLEGSSRCGKTALVQQLCAGRRRVIYIPFREQQVTPRTIANAFGYRTFGSEDIGMRAHTETHTHTHNLLVR